MTDQEIHDICEKYDIKNYTINSDGSIDVNQNVYLSGKSLYKIPLKFNRVYGSFDINNNRLTSLEGITKNVISYYLYFNPLESLDGYDGDLNDLNCIDKVRLVKIKWIVLSITLLK